MSEVWQARFERERRARKEAELLLEQKSRELFAKNEELVELTQGLEQEVQTRTKELATSLAAEREMNQRQRTFISVVSHEFRTPLAIIDGTAQRLARNANTHDPADLMERVKRIRGGVGRLTELIERTLSSSKLDETGIKLERQPVALADLVETICSRQREIAKDFRILTDLEAVRVTVQGDPALLDQIFTNLLSNAVKYSGERRSIAVLGTAVSAEAVEIAVSDGGLGIPEEEISKLFQRFFRASTAKGIAGTGIGLHLVRQLVELHGGSIKVESTLGEGSTFTVRLPLPAAS